MLRISTELERRTLPKKIWPRCAIRKRPWSSATIVAGQNVYVVSLDHFLADFLSFL